MKDLRLLFHGSLTNVRQNDTLLPNAGARRMNMLKIVTRMQNLNFGELMELYREGNEENGARQYPMLSATEQLLQAEQDFYQYLIQCFFPTDGAVYVLWEEKGKYLSGLRLEPYQDGLLLEALETAPTRRRQGYACKLLRSVQDWLSQHGAIKVYSHVDRRNVASQRCHQNCGFAKILNHAVYADGSVLTSADTYLFAVE
jgi:RimJ/RimL family protein N-acetyltransferase